jgi:hypothetical protein
MALPNRTKENPWHLKTPPGTSEYTMHVEEKDGTGALWWAPRSCGLETATGQTSLPVHLTNAVKSVPPCPELNGLV